MKVLHGYSTSRPKQSICNMEDDGDVFKDARVDRLPAESYELRNWHSSSYFNGIPMLRSMED